MEKNSKLAVVIWETKKSFNLPFLSFYKIDHNDRRGSNNYIIIIISS